MPNSTYDSEPRANTKANTKANTTGQYIAHHITAHSFFKMAPNSVIRDVFCIPAPERAAKHASNPEDIRLTPISCMLIFQVKAKATARSKSGGGRRTWAWEGGRVGGIRPLHTRSGKLCRTLHTPNPAMHRGRPPGPLSCTRHQRPIRERAKAKGWGDGCLVG